MTILEEAKEVIDERTTHAPPLPEGVLEHHLDQDIQKRIAVQNLNKISFVIAPDGKSAISAEEIKSSEHREIVEASLQTVLGERPDSGAYLPPAEGLGEKLGLSSASQFVKIEGAGTIKMLAEAGVKDFASALNISHSNHRDRVR